jgi:hypothetical protein
LRDGDGEEGLELDGVEHGDQTDDDDEKIESTAESTESNDELDTDLANFCSCTNAMVIVVEDKTAGETRLS